MESYRVGGLANSGLQRRYDKRESTTRATERNGAYGLSIRVKGMDGHPYVVMNNQNRGPDSNGNIDKDSLMNDGDENDFRGAIESAPGKITNPHNGAKESRKLQKSSSLRNIQRDTEPVNPYAPENSSLSRDRYRTLPPKCTSPVETPAQQHYSLPRATSTPVHRRSPSLGKPSTPESPVAGEEAQPDPRKAQGHPQALPRIRPPSQLQAEPQAPKQLPAKTQSQAPSQLPAKTQSQAPRQLPAKTQSQPPSQLPAKTQSQPPSQVPAKTQPQAPSQVPAKTQSQPPDQTPVVRHPPRNSTKFIGRSPSTVGGTASLEQGRRNPDVLPLRRHESCGPEFLPPRSRRSSTSSAPDGPQPEEEALYAENINRHKNRRYIPFVPGTGRDIDSASIPSVDDLIEKFNGSGTHQRRGRAGRRNRINPEDRKRSRSLDSFLPSELSGDSEYLDRFSRNQGRPTEHLLRPSQLGLQKGTHHQEDQSPAHDCSSPESPQGAVCNGLSSVLSCKNELKRSSTLQLKTKTYEEEKPSRSVKILTSTTPRALSRSSNTDKQLDTARDTQVTPDLLKGQQDVSQQTNEETARQILFNYLKDGSGDNDDATKRKVNLVFEKIQTLRSRAAANVQGDKSPGTAAESRAVQDLKAQLESKVTELTKQLEEESKKQRGLVEACEKAGADTKDLGVKLSSSREECRKLREQLSKAEAELQTSLEDLYQEKMEREQCQSDIRDLQDQLSEMHDELDCAKKPSTDEEMTIMMETIMQMKLELEEAQLAKEMKEEVLHKRERELTALKGALKEEVASHDQEVDIMKEQYEQEIQKLRLAAEEAKQASSSACREKAELEVALGTVDGRAGQLSQEAERLRQRAQELERQVAKLNRVVDEAKLRESRLEDRAGRLEKEKRQMEVSLDEAREQEQETSQANRTLATRLDELQRNMAKLTQEYNELSDRLREESSQKDLMKKTKNQVEDERRLLDRTVEKLQRAMGEIAEASQASTLELQLQINEYKEKSRQETSELQRQLRDKDLEQEKVRLASKRLQEEMSQLEEDLRQCKRERDEAFLMGQDLKQKVYDLEVDVETKSHCKDDRSRQMKLMEDRVSQLEQDLEEERLNGDEMMNRVNRGREQVEQLRNELLQERAARQDLECDKLALERRNKDLKGRLDHLEGSQKSTKEGVVTQLEGRIQELEERLEVEERDRGNLLQANRKLERRVKDVSMQLEDERHSLQDQKDQLVLKLKVLKRQMDESEEETERLENGRKKLQRDLDEQTEANEQLQGQVNTLRKELRRKSSAAPLLNNLDDDEDDDDFSTSGEFFYSLASGRN
ncbi:cingulin-like protein 1 [Conger conger]|uniref:cingulin-like protein 1 n=1 Tax=Conger conger TaxID=82655 RepID=UPI002A5997C7|nr:cingulin-like protein 1 [Conger conger]